MTNSVDINGWLAICPDTHTYDSLRHIILQNEALFVTEFYLGEYEAAIALGLLEWEYVVLYNAYKLTSTCRFPACTFVDGKVYVPIE